MQEVFDKIGAELVPAIDQYYATKNLPALQYRITNNNENIPLSFIEHTTGKNRVVDMYKRAHPHILTGIQPNTTDIDALSKFLQTPTWFPCPNNPKCYKSQIVHRPDLAIIFQEPAGAAPPNAMPFRIPIFICEVEGRRDGWGRYEQEHKALEESISTLAFMPDTFLMFIFHNRFEFWYLERNPADGCIEITSHPIYLQSGGEVAFSAAMNSIVDLITGILVRQLVRNGDVLRLSMAQFRTRNLRAYYDPPVGHGTYICANCWVLALPTTASLYCAQHQQNAAALPNYE